LYNFKTPVQHIVVPVNPGNCWKNQALCRDGKVKNIMNLADLQERQALEIVAPGYFLNEFGG
jgi:hypothetical protein